MATDILQILVTRTVQAFSTWPTVQEWGMGLLWLCGYGAVVIPVGLRCRLLKLEIVRNRAIAIQAAVISFLVPSVLEEFLFRVLPIPHPTESVSMVQVIGWAIAALVCFVLAHPLNGRLYLKAAYDTFHDPLFLSFAGLLGIVCSITYLSFGSIWIPVLIHWIVVVIWLLGLGGLRRTSPPEDHALLFSP